MKLKCQGCGAVCSLDVAIGHTDASTAIAAALELHPLGKPLIKYLALFRPIKQDLSFDRVAKLLNELIPMIKAAQIERDGRTWPAPQAYWQSALEQMLARDGLSLPLKGHGYLLSIIAGMGNKAEAQQEAKKEKDLRERPETPPAPRDDAPRPNRLSQEDRDKGRAAVRQLTSQFRL